MSSPSATLCRLDGCSNHTSDESGYCYHHRHNPHHGVKELAEKAEQLRQPPAPATPTDLSAAERFAQAREEVLLVQQEALRDPEQDPAVLAEAKRQYVEAQRRYALTEEGYADLHAQMRDATKRGDRQLAQEHLQALGYADRVRAKQGQRPSRPTSPQQSPDNFSSQARDVYRQRRETRRFRRRMAGMSHRRNPVDQGMDNMGKLLGDFFRNWFRWMRR